MTLPMSRAEAAPVAAIPSLTRVRQLGLGQRLGQVVGQDGDLGLLLVDEVLSPTGPEGVDRLASGLDLTRQDGEVLVVGQRAALALLDAVGGTRDHAQDIAAQTVTAAHGDGDV